MASDELVGLIRARVEDPATRTESVPDTFSAALRSSSPSALGSLTAELVGHLERLRRGTADDATIRRADQVRRAMTEPRVLPLPTRATDAQLERAEAEMDLTLPPLLRRLYLEVANGGFGPGPGLIGVQGGWPDSSGRTIEAVYDMLVSGDPDIDDWAWPAGLLPMVDAGPVWICVETSGAHRVIEFDYEEIEYSGWPAAFTPVADSLDAWLDAWARGSARGGPEVTTIAAGDVDAARRSREMIAKMSPAERQAMGLPEEGWEEVVWGGIGLDGDGH